MKFALLTTLAVSVAFAAATKNHTHAPKEIPELVGADQLADIELGNPDYCSLPTPSDRFCYKDGYPKCCFKRKGNCPVNEDNKPDCECDGLSCNPGSDNGGVRRNTPTRNPTRFPTRFPTRNTPTRNTPTRNTPTRNTPTRNTCELGRVNDCQFDEYCAVQQGICLSNIAQVFGICLPRPLSCQTNIDLVCGCDNETYANECAAEAAGVSVAKMGQCIPLTSCTYFGTNDDTCPGQQFCNIGEGNCRLRVSQQQGFCHPEPTSCNVNSDRVCGCDGDTYQNECIAFSNGVNVERQGRC